MNKLSNSNRRTLINMIAILAVVQVSILIYLWTLFRPAAPPGEAEPTVQQFQLPSAASTSVPGDAQPTPIPGSVESVVGQPVRATNYADRALAFDEEQAMEHLAYLADDELGGRQSGTPGGRAAGDYVAATFADYGLQPAGADGTYFQTFTVPYGRITELPILTITPPPGAVLTRTYAYRQDYRAFAGGYLGAGEGEGPVVWLNECLHDDYAGLDMVGKIALCRYTGESEIYRQAIEHQVGGLLLLDREGTASPYRRPAYRETAWVPQTIPACLISETVAVDLLVGTNYTLDDLSLRFTATPLSTTVRMAVVTEEREEVEARNVLGLLPGSDPDYSDEIVIVGAHYDHLGREPDGAIMNGANDNASGVAAMLEIARLWQAQGYRPARSVLFAAWDSEELGLLGARHYVYDPTYPLTRTVANLNLDMVSAGENLRIDGEGMVVTQLEAGAGIYGITTTVTFGGSSDHISFHEAGVPAANLIYWPDAYYHSVDDQVQIIEPDKLKTAGVLAAHTLAALAEGQIELERAVERLEATIATGDRDQFLAGIDPTDPGLRTAQATWFDDLWSRELAEMEIEADRLRIGDGEASASLSLAYRWADAVRRESPISYDARFVQRDGAWYFAGYELDSLSGDALTVARFPSTELGADADVTLEMQQLLSTTQQTYLTLTADLGVEPITSTRCIYYPNVAALRAIARPAADRETSWLIPSAEQVEIALGQPITPALVHLALNQMGLPPGAGDWLREGLVIHYQDGETADYLSALATAGELAPLSDFPALSGVPDSEAQALRAQAWGVTEYLLDTHGTTGLQALCAAWGRSGDLSSAFQQALGLSPTQFEAAWRAARLDPLRADAQAIQSTIAARAEAVLAGEEADFLATVSPADPILRTSERNWFSDLAEHPLTSYEATGEIAGWSPGGEGATVALSVSLTTSGGRASQVTYDARFIREGGRWLYAGVAWDELAGEHFILKYQAGSAAFGPQRILDLAEEAYAQITADLNAPPPLPQEIKIYDEAELFRASLSPSLPDVSSWTEPGEGIKLWLQDERLIQTAIARELARQVLLAQGLRTDWLHEGIAAFEAGRATPLGTHWVAGNHMPTVQEAIRRHNEFPLYDMPSWEDVPDDQADLFRAQSWSLISFIFERHGLAGLRRFVAQSLTSDNAVTDIQVALRVAPETFEAEWREHVRIAGVPGDLVSLARRFDPERALAHVTVLASPELGGRRAGSPGADLAADYIAGQFAALGLEPLGDPLTGTQRSYLQQFPISYTHVVSVPTLALLKADGTLLHEFTYRQDFMTSAGQGNARGELVWVRPNNLEGMYFGGAVVLEQDMSMERAQQLEEHGAGGVVIVTDKEPDDLQASYVQPVSASELSIPVFEITGAAFETLLGELGLGRGELVSSPPALPLGVLARQTLARSPVTTTLTANVLGLLPGSDPEYSDEVLLVGAHYDHIGQLPDGFYFPGANQNGSGVAAMLEMARVWQSAGYRPGRSVLFVAWGAEEVDGAGVARYLADPAVPVTQTVGVIALESIAGGGGAKLMFHGTREHDLALIHRFEAGYAELDRRAWRQGSVGEGWHVPFNAAGIPTSKLIWDEAEEDFYLPTDTADRIDPDWLASSGEILTLVVSWLAGQ